MKQFIIYTALAVTVTACTSKPDVHTTVSAPHIPTPQQVPQQSASLEPMIQNASLWTTTPDSLLSMRRAKDVGDLLTVLVDLDDQASLQNSLSRNRDADRNLSIGALFGLTDLADGVLPGGNTLSPGVSIDRSTSMNGGGQINRAEQIEFRLACRVVGVEPSGNLIIEGFQQIQVSDENRFLHVSGVIRPQDINRSNTVSYDQIADARLIYTSDGEATGPVGRKSGERFLDKYLPF